jgi:branched-chain amino acid transport system permease protein
VLSELWSSVSRALGPAGIYIMLGLGYNVIYATSNVFNLAQGELAMFGMFIGLTLTVTLGAPVGLAFVAVILVIAFLATLEERFVIRPTLRGAGADSKSITWAITTLAFASILAALAEILWGTEPRRLPSLVPERNFEVFGSTISSAALTIFLLALVVALLLHVFSTRSLAGKALAAVSQDPEAASLRGINVPRMRVFAFVVGGAIAAIAGLLMAPLTFVYPAIGGLYTFKGFVAIAIGGMGNNAGALLGGFLLALVEVVAADTIGAGYRDTVAMVFLLVVLLAKPHGILGHVQERAV